MPVIPADLDAVPTWTLLEAAADRYCQPVTHNYPAPSGAYTLDALARLTRAMRVTNRITAIRRTTPPHKLTQPGTGAHRPEHLGPFATPVDVITADHTATTGPVLVIHEWDTNPFPCCTTPNGRTGGNHVTDAGLLVDPEAEATA